jgi:hypothetical protein
MSNSVVTQATLPVSVLPVRPINLLPAEIKQKTIQRGLIFPAFAAIVLTAASVAAGTVLLDQLLETTQGQAASKEVQLSLNPEKPAVLAEEAGLQKDADILTKQTVALNTLATTEVDWSRVFSFIQAAVPKDIALASTSVNAKGAATVAIIMNGAAPSNASFGQFSKAMRGLKAEQKIANYSQDGYSYEPLTGKVTFSVTIELPVSAVRYQQAKGVAK